MDFICFDTEDNTPELVDQKKSLFEKKITQIYAISTTGKEFYGEENSVDAFKEWLSRFPKGTACYAHNLSYDLGALFAFELDELNIKMVGGRMISAKWRGIIFKDSMNLWPMALKKVGKSVGIEKGSLDVRSKEYIATDVRILMKAIQESLRFARGYGLDKLPTTIGGLATRIYKAKGGNHWHCPDDWYRRGYFGGRVELFNQGGCGVIYYVDINSLYPSQMILPYPDEVYPKDDIDGWGMAEIDILIPKQPICPLPCRRDDNSIFFPYGKIIKDETAEIHNGVWTFHEIRNAIENHGCKLLKIHKSMGTSRAICYYKDFVLDLYNQRKTSNDEAIKLILKLVMNNLYGQLAQSGKVTMSKNIKALYTYDECCELIVDDDGAPVLAKDGICYGTKILCEVTTPLQDHVNILHGAYVTSYARLRLLEFIRKIDVNNLIYCDTDSLIFWHDPKKPLPFLISDELGEMKLEGIYENFYTYAPKVYRGLTNDGESVYKAKGIPQRHTEEDRRKIDAGLLSKKKAKTLPQIYIESGKASYLQPYKFRESARYFNELDPGKLSDDSKILAVWREVTKNKQTDYDKKILLKDGIYFPKSFKKGFDTNKNK